MIKIYSKVQPDLLLHVVFKYEDFDTMADFREEIIAPDQFIQCAALNMKKGKTFRPHKHIIKEVTDLDRIAQESWVVLKGQVKCIFYDIDDTIIEEPILNEGDSSYTLRGGHNYLVLSENAKILEYKTGRYFGQKYDKTFIE